MSYYQNYKDNLDNKEDIIAITPYCRTCNTKLKTKEGAASHRNQKHEVLQMKIQAPQPSYQHSHISMKSTEQNPYELLHNIDYSQASKSL